MRPVDVAVEINGKSVPKEDVLIISDQENIRISGDLPVISLAYDSSASDPTRDFFQEAYAYMQDSALAIFLVAPQFRDVFGEFKGYFEEHFTNGRRNNKVYVVGEGPVSSYSIRVKQQIETIVMNQCRWRPPRERQAGRSSFIQRALRPYRDPACGEW